MNETQRRELAAMRDGAAAKLAWHRQQMAGNAAWLDEVAGRRAMADQITSDLEAFIARADRDLSRETSGRYTLIPPQGSSVAPESFANGTSEAATGIARQARKGTAR